VIQRAAANGRDTGEYCQGGAYVVSRRLLDAMAESGAFADPLVWRDLEICEDFRMGLHCGAAGLSIRDVSQSGPRFAIDPKCLAMSREELSRSPYSVIHSIRGSMEAEVRAFFRERRPARSMPAASM
jgi:hypothetical protein